LTIADNDGRRNWIASALPRKDDDDERQNWIASALPAKNDDRQLNPLGLIVFARNEAI